MTSKSKKWDSLKAEYLRQVEKALSSVKHPRSKDILEDVHHHLDRRFAELEPDQQTWENFQAIITEMGPASDYAEPLSEEQTPQKQIQYVTSKLLLLVALAFTTIAAAMIVLPMAFDREKAYEPIETWCMEDLVHPFVNDPEIIGYWKSVDFVERIEDFDPNTKAFKGKLFLKDVEFMLGGRMSLSWTWTKDWILHSNGKTKAQYRIKKIDGQMYLFLPWLSGDVIKRGQKPRYYALKKTIAVVAKSTSFQTVKPIDAVKEFDDMRWKDLSKLTISGRPNLIATLRFNKKTIWPEAKKLPAGCDPNRILTNAMNPGLGVRKLHRQGITGKGVNVAIIDQPMYLDHPEFAGKIVEYYDTGSGSKSSMHGPAVTSLLVGTNCGTAPDARVYYAAVPSWKRDTAYEAKALEWIIEQNKKLPASKKIRVVSVSAAPSSPKARDKNQHMWGRVCARAESAGMIVLDCTEDRGFIGKCWYNAKMPESVSACTPGDPRSGYHNTNRLLVPSAPRTTAEEYDKGDCSYQYCGTGGLSWSIPYCSGVLALGWQIRPDLKPEQMREILFESAYKKKNGAKIINPEKFIQLVKKATLRTGKNKLTSRISQNPVGRWRTIDFVHNIDAFKPGQKSWQGTFYLKGLTFFRDGRTSKVWKWSKGYLWHPGERTKSKYLIKEIGGSIYLFLEWKDRATNKTSYYVLKKM